jgi:hypothetical protein
METNIMYTSFDIENMYTLYLIRLYENKIKYVFLSGENKVSIDEIQSQHELMYPNEYEWIGSLEVNKNTHHYILNEVLNNNKLQIVEDDRDQLMVSIEQLNLAFDNFNENTSYTNDVEDKAQYLNQVLQKTIKKTLNDEQSHQAKHLIELQKIYPDKINEKTPELALNALYEFILNHVEVSSKMDMKLHFDYEFKNKVFEWQQPETKQESEQKVDGFNFCKNSILNNSGALGFQEFSSCLSQQDEPLLTMKCKLSDSIKEKTIDDYVYYNHFFESYHVVSFKIQSLLFPEVEYVDSIEKNHMLKQFLISDANTDTIPLDKMREMISFTHEDHKIKHILRNVSDIISNSYTISDDPKKRIKSSILLNEIIDLCQADNTQSRIITKHFTTLLKNLGLQKKRYADGNYYYGIHKIERASVHSYKQLDKQNIQEIYDAELYRREQDDESFRNIIPKEEEEEEHKLNTEENGSDTIFKMEPKAFG